MKNFTRYRTIELLELFAGSVLPIIFWTSVIFGFDAPYIAILTIISAVLHEIGHLAAISFFTVKNTKLSGHSSGFRIRKEGFLSYGKEISILLAGPAINIVVFFLTLPFGNALYGYVKILGYINLATGLSNLLPLEGYDGYGAICELFKSVGKPHLIRRIETFSFVFSVCITFISLHLIDTFGEGYWIFGLFFLSVMSKIANFGKYSIFEE